MMMTFEDEELAFRCFCQVMNKFMHHVYAKDFEKLQLQFGSFKKLIDLHLPELSSHFRVTSLCYPQINLTS